jgi:hypothetical protein
MKFIDKISLKIIAIIIIFSIPSIIPLFKEGFFVTDDAEWMIIRLSAFYQALSDGQFPVRFLGRLNHEHGYPVATFLYPGFMYLGSIIHLLKINIIDSVKIILGFSMVLSSLFTFLWLRKFFDNIPSLIGSFIYLYTPYHLYDLYKRGSVGELMAITVLPFILWQIERKSIFWSATGIGLLILSHNTLAFIFLILIMGYVIFDLTISKKKEWSAYMTILLAGVGLAAFYWIPVIFELRNTVFSKTIVSDWRGYFADINLIGYSTVLIIISATALFIFDRSLIKKHWLTVFFIILGIFSVFISSQASAYLWNYLPSAFIQFPFRFLSLSLISLAFTGAFIVTRLSSWYRYAFIFVTALTLLISCIQYLKSVEYINKGESFYTTNSSTTTTHDEYMPIWVREKSTQRPDTKVEIIDGEGAISNIYNDNKKVLFTAKLTTDSVIRLNIIYWPGWKASVNDKSHEIFYKNSKGVMDIELAKGQNQVKIEFFETRLRLASDIISVISLCFLLYVSFIKKRIKTK